LSQDTKAHQDRKAYYLKLAKGFTVILVIALFGVCAYVTLSLGVFTVHEVTIAGNEKILEKEILQRSGLRLGESSIFFFEDRIAEDILKNPWIRSVKVQKEFPKRVHIEIEEEKVYCIVFDSDGNPHYLSSSGKMLNTDKFDEGLDFPVLIGEGIENSDLLEEALQILDLSSKSSVLDWSEISEIHIDNIYGIDVYTTDRRHIVFDRGDVFRKWRKLESIIKHADNLGLKQAYINISSSHMGVVSFEAPTVDSGAQDG
jgi:cell division protein FtsQ